MVHAVGCREGEGRSSHRDKTDRVRSCHAAELISPGAATIGNDRGLQRGPGRHHLPEPVAPFHALDPRIAQKFDALTARGLQVTAVNRVDIDIAGSRLPEGGFDPACLQDRAPFLARSMVEGKEDAADDMGKAFGGEFRVLGIPSEEEKDGTTGDQGNIGKTVRRAVEEPAGFGRERLDHRAAYHVGVMGRRTSSAVIPGLFLCLDDHHPPVGGETPGKRGPDHTCSDDDHVKFGHDHSIPKMCGWCRRGDSNSRPTDYETVHNRPPRFSMRRPMRRK